MSAPSLNIRTLFFRQANEKLVGRLTKLYGEEQVEACVRRLSMMFGRYGVGEVFGDDNPDLWDENDAYLITYGDMVQGAGEAPLASLKTFADNKLQGAINTIHILPFLSV